MSPHLSGIVAAAITPLSPDFEIDVPRLAAHTQRLLDQGCSFVSSFGTTGEGASLATADKLRALGELARTGTDMQRQIPAIMTASLDDAARMLKGIGELGCRAALVLPPFYYPQEDAGISDWFDALIARTAGAPRIDLLLYNIPKMTEVAFTGDLVDLLLRRHVGRIVGIKDSTGDIEGTLALTRRFRNLAIFSGDDRVLPALRREGGAGLIGGMPNVFAADLRALFDHPGNAELLERQTRRITTVNSYGGLVALKAALAAYLADEDYARALPPLRALDAADRQRVLDEFAQSTPTPVA